MFCVTGGVYIVTDGWRRNILAVPFSEFQHLFVQYSVFMIVQEMAVWKFPGVRLNALV
jgi:hypothetical protein